MHPVPQNRNKGGIQVEFWLLIEIPYQPKLFHKNRIPIVAYEALKWLELVLFFLSC